MYPVTQDFLDKMKADRRQVLARAVIDYTDPFMDQSIEIEASEQANVSYPQQTADSVDTATHKWASLDGSWVLDGTFALAPPPDKLSQYQFGWWGKQLAGAGGAFSAPYPSLTVTHLPRPIHTLRVVGDTARGEYPVDFTIKLYAQNEAILYTETVTGNTQVNWSKTLAVPVLDVAKQVLTITRWSHEGRQAKIIEFFTSIREVYETGDLVSLRLLEEREASQGSLPVGNISSNEVTLALNNESKKFDVDNDQSPLKNLLKPNRRIQVWLGTDAKPGLVFDGVDDYIDCGNDNSLDITDDLTIEILMKADVDTPTVGGVVKGIVGGWASNSYGLRNSNNNLRFFITDGSAIESVDIPVPKGEICHIAGVTSRTGGKLYGYQNYEKVVEGDRTIQSIRVTTGPLNIGRPYLGGASLKGAIYEVRIWNKALTEEELLQYKDKELTGKEEGLIACYDFSEGSGTTAYDSAGNNHGIIHGARWFDGWVPLGTFWSLDWDSPDDTLEATVTARDRMELLRKGTYQTSQVQENKSLYELAEAVLQDAGLNSNEYIIDTDLQSIVVPYAWFNPISHREALRRIAEAGLAAAFQNRDGKIQIESFLISGVEPVLEITEDDYFPPLRTPSRQDQVANEIIVDTQPLRPSSTSEEVYRSNEPVTIPASSTRTITAFYNQPPVIQAVASLNNPPAGVSIVGATYYGWGASVAIRNTNTTDRQVTLIINGKPLTIQNKERAIARDEASITENGPLRYEFPANPLVQTLAQAQAIADALLASVKDPRRDIEMDWRGNPALELGDRVAVKDQDYHVIRQELEWTGALSARLTGRRAT